MGNHKFRLSEMIPNAWFYKLKDMGRARNQSINKKKKQPPNTSSSSASSSSLTSSSLSSSTSSSSTTTTTSIPPESSKLPNQPPHTLLSHQRKSYYFTRDLTPPPPTNPPPPPLLQDPQFQIYPPNPKPPETHFQESPRKSTKQKQSIKRLRNRASVSPRPPPKLVAAATVSAGFSCRASLDLTADDYPISPLDSTPLSSDHDQNPQNDIVFDMSSYNSSNPKSDEFNSVSNLKLPPILTMKQPKLSNSAEFEERKAHADGYISNFTEQRTSSVRRISVSSPGVRIRANSPRIASKKIGRKTGPPSSGGRGRRSSSVSESFAVVKSSADPKKDFRESMVEMIVENNIRGSKDLEDLLACYLQLNSDEYHEVIIKVFKQIWFDLANVKLK